MKLNKLIFNVFYSFSIYMNNNIIVFKLAINCIENYIYKIY
jgi:hypothetical protein